jgi:hypothetical protein
VEISAPGGQTIAPGDAGKIIVKMSTGPFTNDLFKEVKVETNDPKADLIVLTMKAKVTEMLKISPRLVNFGRMMKGQTASREISVENVSESSIRITRLEATPENLLAVQPSEPFTLKPGQSKKLTVKISTGSSGGFVGGYVNLETNLEYLPKKTVHVRVEVKEKQESAR